MADCAIRALWGVADRAARKLLERVSIADLVRTEQSLALALGLEEEPVRDRGGPGEP
jgi:DNA-binding IscR family transcriptional regulator